MRTKSVSLTSKQKEDLLNEVNFAKLPMPKEVKIAHDAIVEKYDGYAKGSIDWIEEFKGRLLLRTFLFERYTSKKNADFSGLCEVSRQIEGCHALMCHVNNYSMMGYRLDVVGCEQWDPMKSWKHNNSPSHPVMNSYHAYIPEEMLKRYAPYINQRDVPYTDMYSFLVLYRKYPGIEYLIKGGYSTMISSSRYLNMNGRNFEQIFKCDKKWAEFLKGKSPMYLQICRSKNIRTEEEAEKMFELLKENSGIGYGGNSYRFLLRAPRRQMLYALDLPRDRRGDYLYYLKLADWLGYPMNEMRYLCPDDLMAAHQEAWRLKVRIQEEERKERIKKEDQEKEKHNSEMEEQAKKLEKFSFEDGNLLIRPARNYQELRKESEVLNHCVRTYFERVCKGWTAIFFIRKKEEPEKPYVTLELKKNRVIQCRAKNNAVPDEEVVEFVKRWKEKYELKGWPEND